MRWSLGNHEMKPLSVLLLTLATLATASLDAKNAKKDEELAPLPLAEGIEITGDFRVAHFPARGVVRYTGRLQITQNGMTLRTPDKDAWVEFHRDGKFVTSKGKWEVEMHKAPAPRRNRGPRRRR